MKFLASKKMSLFCSGLNIVFAVLSFSVGAWAFMLLNLVLAYICYRNYIGEDYE
tara:strand:+ start:1174 stop:1335 length:162 start_codon:yes stop_codon:yes gene_type:complete